MDLELKFEPKKCSHQRVDQVRNLLLMHCPYIPGFSENKPPTKNKPYGLYFRFEFPRISTWAYFKIGIPYFLE